MPKSPFSRLQSLPESSRVDAIDGSLSAFTMVLRAESQLPESQLLFAEVAELFLESRVQSLNQRGALELAGCHSNSRGRSPLLDCKDDVQKAILQAPKFARVFQSRRH